jgi:hypothetical protein
VIVPGTAIKVIALNGLNASKVVAGENQTSLLVLI